MEYEQLERGNRILRQCVENQDVDPVLALLHPSALLVTHFPYPDTADDTASAAAGGKGNTSKKESGGVPAAAASLSPTLTTLRGSAAAQRARKAQLLAAQSVIRQQQQTRYEARQQSRLTGAEAEATDFHHADGSSAATAAATVTAAGAAGAPAGAAAASAAKGGNTARAKGSAAGKNSGLAAHSRVHRGIAFFFSQPPALGSGAAAGGDVGDATVAAHYGDYVEVSEGRLMVAARFGLLLSWLSRAPFIAEVSAQLEPRKGVLQDAEVLPPPPAPRTQQEAYAQLGRQHTDRNQQLSRLTLVWGREHLLFSDAVYFEEGLIVCVHRRLLTLSELLPRLPPAASALSLAQRTELVRSELRDFYGVSQGRVATVNHALPLLDFSFLDIGAHTLRLLQQRAVPVGGHRHVSRPVRPAVDPQFAQGVFLNAGNDPAHGAGTGRTLIKAKNKDGEEEAYEFDNGARQRYLMLDGASAAVDDVTDVYRAGTANASSGGSAAGGRIGGPNSAGGGESALRGFKYDATSLRISGCQLETNDSAAAAPPARGGAATHGEGAGRRRPVPFAAILRGLVANAMLTLSCLDLSDNCLAELPDLSAFPLQRLLLHGNRIDDWAWVERVVCPLRFLSSVTLYGNPIADRDSGYWSKALACLLKDTDKPTKLRQLDFVQLTAQDYNEASMHR